MVTRAKKKGCPPNLQGPPTSEFTSLVGRGEAKRLQVANFVRSLLTIELELRRGHGRSSFDALVIIFALGAASCAASQAMRH